MSSFKTGHSGRFLSSKAHRPIRLTPVRRPLPSPTHGVLLRIGRSWREASRFGHLRRVEVSAHFAIVCHFWYVGSMPRSSMNVSLTPELEKFVDDKVESGLYNNASEVIREGLRLLKEHDEVSLKWRESIERGWLQAQRGELVDGDIAFRRFDERIKKVRRKRV